MAKIPGRIAGCKIHLFLIILFPFILKAQDSLREGFRSVENDVFGHGEYLKYRVFYDSWLTYWMTAGVGIMEISDEPHVVDGRETYRIEVTGNSTGLFTLFYKVRDKFVSYVDKQAVIPLKFTRRTREGKFRLDDDVSFNQIEGYAVSNKKRTNIPPNIQDIVSAFYYTRTIDFDTAKAGDEYFIPFFLDDSVYRSKIIFLGRKRIETSLGKFDCMGFKPQVAQGDLFKDPYPMELWVTDDKNKVPILGRSAVYIGSITIELTEFSGLRYPLGEKGGN
jgi:hypothetical protein